jgi:hypothetical protein
MHEIIKDKCDHSCEIIVLNSLSKTKRPAQKCCRKWEYVCHAQS